MRVLLIVLAAMGVVVGLIALTLVILSPRFTPMIEGPEFRAELDKQTSKGLHFTGRYEPIKRTGFASVETAGFKAADGVKAMKSLEARGITGTFNPWGVLLRRWQIDRVNIERGIVEIQVYEPKPEPKKSRPWYAIFMPDRVYLCEVTCANTDVTWKVHGERSGIFGTQLRITPHGRDFVYRAKGGTLRNNGLTPDMTVQAIHMLITKTVLELYQLDLATKEGGSIHVTGDAGMRDEKHVDAKLEFDGVAVGPWLPAELQEGVSGRARGGVTWKAGEQTLEASTGQGQITVTNGELNDLALLDYLAAATGKKTLEHVELERCEVKFRWKFSEFEVTSLDLGSEGKFSLRGTLKFGKGGSLTGTLELGMAPALLAWLPRAKEEIFTKAEEGLLWTTVHLSGSLEKPENDLGPRLATALRQDPAAAAGLFFRGFGEWLEQKTRGR